MTCITGCPTWSLRLAALPQQRLRYSDVPSLQMPI